MPEQLPDLPAPSVEGLMRLVDEYRYALGSSSMSPKTHAEIMAQRGASRVAIRSYAERLAVPQWQPIETAPRDGSHILLYRPEIQFTGYYAVRAECWCINAPGLPKMDPGPTHWMPLPAAPIAAMKEKTNA